MQFLSQGRNRLWLGILVVMIVVDCLAILFYTPMIPQQHWDPEIFYIHVPVAWTGFLSYFIVMVAGIMYLAKKRPPLGSHGVGGG